MSWIFRGLRLTRRMSRVKPRYSSRASSSPIGPLAPRTVCMGGTTLLCLLDARTALEDLQARGNAPRSGRGQSLRAPGADAPGPQLRQAPEPPPYTRMFALLTSLGAPHRAALPARRHARRRTPITAPGFAARTATRGHRRRPRTGAARALLVAVVIGALVAERGQPRRPPRGRGPGGTGLLHGGPDDRLRPATPSGSPSPARWRSACPAASDWRHPPPSTACSRIPSPRSRGLGLKDARAAGQAVTSPSSAHPWRRVSTPKAVVGPTTPGAAPEPVASRPAAQARSSPVRL